MEEIWKPIKGFVGYYEVSNLGRVRSVDRIVYDIVRHCFRHLKGKVLTIRDNGNGYKSVMFCMKHKLYNKYVHILVAEAFLDNPYHLPQVNHKDENKANNTIGNLEWCTSYYNNEYGTRKERWYKTRIKNGTIDPSHVHTKIRKRKPTFINTVQVNKQYEKR